MVHIRKKRRESVPVARPTHRGLRIAQSCLNEQRRSPTPICIYTSHYPMRKRTGTMRVCIKHTHRASTVAMSLTGLEVCEVSYASKNKASSKRLSTIYVSPFQPPFLQGLRHGDKAKIKKKRKSGLKRMKKIPFQRQKPTSAERKINLSRTIFQSQPNDFSFCGRIFHGFKSL